jgi:HTH-type transcriptional regulator/antitoxin MqsA
MCPICAEGVLEPQQVTEHVEYKGHDAELALAYSICTACGSEQSDAAQLRANKRAMVAFKKRVDGLLTGAEVRRLRKQLNLSQEDAARVFGGGPVAFSKYEADDVAQSAAMDKLLRLAAEMPGAAARLFRQAGMEPALTVADWQDAGDWIAPAEDRGEGAPRKLSTVSSSTPRHQPHADYQDVDPSDQRLDECSYG